MKKTYSLFTLMMIAPITGCSFSPLSFSAYQNDFKEIETKFDIDEDNYYSYKEFKNLSYERYQKVDGEVVRDEIKNFRQLYSSTNNGRSYLNQSSIGEQKILVLPISFKDSDKNNRENKLIYIKNAFFGTENHNSYYSVSEYFNRSSYGHLKLSGEVADFYDVDLSSKDILNKINSKTSSSRYLTSLALENYYSKHEDVSEYDNDNDGFIDGIFVIYDYPYSSSTDSLFWAYVDHMNRNESVNFTNGETIKINNSDNYPEASTYGWASLDFLHTNDKKVDSHVYIHESGHIFGLMDYYSNGNYQPLGYLDMMDYNLGDHNAYSKMLLNWLTPKVIKDEGEISLRPFNETGDCLIIPNGEWNGSVYDEYILLEYYAPTGLNEKETKLTFEYHDANKNVQSGRYYSQYGLKVYHVDSRIGYFRNKGISSLICLLDDEDASEKLEAYRNIPEVHNSYCLDFAYSNNDLKHPLIKLLESKENDNLRYGLSASNASLFHVGDDFGINYFKNYKFYDGEEIGYKFEIKSATPKEIKITFSK